MRSPWLFLPFLLFPLSPLFPGPPAPPEERDPMIERLSLNVSYLERAQMDGGDIVTWYRGRSLRRTAPQGPPVPTPPREIP